MKVPTLRNVDKRPSAGVMKAYGHNGYFKSLDEIVSLWSAVREGGPLEILQSVRIALVDPQDETDLSLALDSLIEPLTLLRRGPVIRALHAELPSFAAASFAENAAVALGACGEWNDALAILDHAHRDGANPHCAHHHAAHCRRGAGEHALHSQRSASRPPVRRNSLVRHG